MLKLQGKNKKQAQVICIFVYTHTHTHSKQSFIVDVCACGGVMGCFCHWLKGSDVGADAEWDVDSRGQKNRKQTNELDVMIGNCLSLQMKVNCAQIASKAWAWNSACHTSESMALLNLLRTEGLPDAAPPPQRRCSSSACHFSSFGLTPKTSYWE